MSKYKIVPVEPDDLWAKFGLWAMNRWQAEEQVGNCRIGAAKACYRAMVNAAPAPVASAEDVERVAEALWLAQTLRLLRDAPEQARLEYAELDDATKGHLRWDARAALRAMGYEVKG